MYNNNDNRKKIEKIPVRASKHNECLNCENYKRKIIESEQTVSSRDVLIHMLQGEIQKLENKYKKSIDDYEKLRYVHCTTLQELTSLNEINKNFEDGRAKFALGRTSNLESEVEVTQKGGQTDQYTSQVASVQWNCCLNKLTTNNSSKNPTCTATTLDQNESPEELLFKFLEEVKQSNCYKENFSNDQVYAVVSDMNKQIQDLNGLMAKLQIEFSTIITNIQNQLEKANESVERLKEENSQVKDQLVEKSSVLSSCLSVLEQNHCNIGNLSDNIKCIIREKDVLYQETQNLKENTTSQCMKKDQEILVMESKINSLNQEKEQLKK
ncbi:hypothetical protein NQ317_012626 [Molorchus minor]|uniref:Uncharacterized protein n=1 Tax=Molorchus minor TaxID=1323400 RepID=A0ABQ9J4H5_9CUCU|nr:hypothetical protein NQ317_012626 [Molorchus minor]